MFRDRLEGRNFQFASQLVMFDLPFNPDLLEQRIGRLDRIGPDAISDHSALPGTHRTGGAGALVPRGLDAFEYTCPTGRTIYDSCYEQLIGYLAAPTEQEGFDEFIHACRQHDQLKAQLEQGRDRLLEMHSTAATKPRRWPPPSPSRITTSTWWASRSTCSTSSASIRKTAATA